MKIDKPYYEDNTRYSNSNIGQYIKYGPKYLRDYLDGKESGLKGTFLDKGSMIHMYILQPEEFFKEYEVLDFVIPTNSYHKSLCEEYVKILLSDPFKDDKVILLESYNTVYNNKKSNDTKIVEADSIVKLYPNYIHYLKKGVSKKFVTERDLQNLHTIKQNLKEHKLANNLLFNLSNDIEVHNEFHINWDYPTRYYNIFLPCKSLLDRFHIDEKNKRITLIDLKTTSSLYEFEHSMQTYDYCRQLMYYWLALTWYFTFELDKDIKDYERDTYIIAISTTNCHVRVFKILNTQLESRQEIIETTIMNICFHHKYNLWDYKPEYYEGDGSEQLNI